VSRVFNHRRLQAPPSIYTTAVGNKRRRSRPARLRGETSGPTATKRDGGIHNARSNRYFFPVTSESESGSSQVTKFCMAGFFITCHASARSRFKTDLPSPRPHPCGRAERQAHGSARHRGVAWPPNA
jgi:hypothetical protein